MVSIKNTNKFFYQSLGKLFYAVAASDNIVRQEELDKLIEVVKDKWLTTLHIEESNKAEASIVNTFKWLHNDNEYDADTCYNSFIVYKNDNPSLFTEDLNNLILKTAGAIASSFSGVNKSELIILAKLNMEFKNI